MEPFFSTRSLTRTHRGVTLIEMMVVLSIIGILSVVVVTSQGAFNKTILLQNTAYDVALTVRSAETFGLGSRVTSTILNPNTGYGVRFTPNSSSFILFADSTPVNPTGCHPLPPSGGSSAPDAIPGDCVYQPSELVTTYALGNGMTIPVSGTCVYTGSWSCSPASVDVVFARPNTKAFISYNGNYPGTVTKARIKIVSPQGGKSCILIEQTGLIRVTSNTTDCP